MGQEVAILNEFQSCFQLSTFLQLTDPEPPLLEIKGGFTQNRVKLYIITTNIDPEDQYSEVKEKNFNKWQAYRRRLSRIIWSAPNPEWTDWEADHALNYARPGYDIGTIPNKWSNFRTGFPGLLKEYFLSTLITNRDTEIAEGSRCILDQEQVPESDPEQEGEPTDSDEHETEEMPILSTYTVGGTQAETVRDLVNAHESIFEDFDLSMDSDSDASPIEEEVTTTKRAADPESSDSEEDLPTINLKPSKRAKYWSEDEMDYMHYELNFRHIGGLCTGSPCCLDAAVCQGRLRVLDPIGQLLEVWSRF